MDIVLSQQEKILRKIRLFLKGRIVGFSVKSGKKYFSSHEESEDFSIGKETSGAEKHYSPQKNDVTCCHIIYNLIRHNRSHLGSFDKDKEYLLKWRWNNWTFNLLKEKYGEQALDFFKIKEMTKGLF